jgi:hypothetical protein
MLIGCDIQKPLGVQADAENPNIIGHYARKPSTAPPSRHPPADRPGLALANATNKVYQARKRLKASHVE